MIEGYRATREGAALLFRPPRSLLRVGGRAPSQMLTGLVSGTIPPPLEMRSGTLRIGRVPYSALLTPKGKMVTDLRVARIGNGHEGNLLLDLPTPGVAGAMTHFRKFLPPRLAQVSALQEPHSMMSLVGPEAPTLLSREMQGTAKLSSEEMFGGNEGDEWIFPGDSEIGLRIIRTDDVVPRAFDLVGTEAEIEALREKLLESGAVPGAPELWEVLRLERGRPRFGAEMDEDTMPAEAGIADRCIDSVKGCYTGQEVVVRIRDRGHVNRHLRGLLLGEHSSSAADAQLFLPKRKQSVGTIRSFAWSPHFNRGIALAMVRREAEPPSSVSIGSPEGPLGALRALSELGWVLVEGDLTFHP